MVPAYRRSLCRKDGDIPPWLSALTTGVLTTGIGWLVGHPFPAVALPVPDDSLGTFITPNVLIQGQPANRIDGGFRPGSGAVLFHSFERFDIGDAERVYFGNPIGVTNIFSRVTSTDPSEIFGTLGVDGPANLFLMNPNGILFGPNARLDISGSFVATTADGIEFGDAGVFSSDRTAPVPSPLTINPSALLFNRITPAPITNQSIAPNLDNPDLIDGLRVPDGQGLLLAGGPITIDGGVMRAPGGRLQLTSIGGAPARVEVGFARPDSPLLALGAAQDSLFADVVITNEAVLDVSGSDRGDIQIDGRNIDISGVSNLCAGLGVQDFCGNQETNDPIGSSTSEAGNIGLFATGQVRLSDFSRIGNNVQENATGNAGNIIQIIAENPADAFGSVIITADALVVDSGAFISTTTFGDGSAGAIVVSSNTVNMDDGALFSQVLEGGVGDAGGIVINAGTVTLDNSSIIGTATDLGTTGNAGGIGITATSLTLEDGSVLSSSAAGTGNAGVMIFNVQELTLNNASSITNNLEDGAIGVGGSISIPEAGVDITLTGGSFIANEVQVGAIGTGGNIEIGNADRFTLSGGSSVSTSTGGIGGAGSILLTAQDVRLTDGSSIESQIFLEATSGDDAGVIRIVADSFFMGDETSLITSTSGVGNAGIITIQASDLTLDNALITSDVRLGATGNSGGIGIVADSLTMNNSRLTTGTGGLGNAGLISINAQTMTLNRTLVESNVFAEGIGDGGSIEVFVNSLNVNNGSEISTSSFGLGQPGGILIQANGPIVMRASTISSNVEAGGRGGISGTARVGAIGITAQSLSLLNGAQLQTIVREADADSPAGLGNAGNIFIVLEDTLLLEGRRPVGFLGDPEPYPSLIASTVGPGTQGNSGLISISADSVIVLNDGTNDQFFPVALSTATFGSGDAGLIQLSVRTIELDGGAVISSEAGRGSTGDAGAISIIALENLLMDGGSAITTSTKGGNAGFIRVEAIDITLDDESTISSAAARRSTGDGGGIILFASDDLLMDGDSSISTSTEGGATGDAGAILIVALDDLVMDNGSSIISESERGSSGNAGAIFLSAAEQLRLSNDSEISTLVEGRRSPQRISGQILLGAEDIILDGSAINAATTAEGFGGGIQIQDNQFLLLINGSNITSSAGFEGTPGSGGDVFIDNDYVFSTPPFDNNITAEAFTGDGGRIFIDARRVYNMAERPDVPTTNDISTDSELGFDGQVTVNELDVDPSRGIINLPTTIVDASNSVNQGCRVANADDLGEFFITGRGGLPPSPSDLLDGDRVLTEWVTSEADLPGSDGDAVETSDQPANADIQVSSPHPTSQLREAQGWMIGSDGDVVLTADAVAATPVPPAVRPATCDDL